MAETDILNPVQGWSAALGDNPNWSYGWIRKTASNKKIAQPRLGRRYSREVMNGGYSANLNFIDRPYCTVLRLKQFFEQFQAGYFTIIDWDGGGRHHVGNFVTEPNEVETANGKYTIQGLTFMECAQARMMVYPSGFETSGHKIYALDDYLSPLVATQGNWNAAIDPRQAFSSSGSGSVGTFTITTGPGSGSVTYGASLSSGASELTIALTGTSATPTGTVNIFINGANVSGGAQALIAGGFTIGVYLPSLTTSYEIVGVYSGDANYPATNVTLTVADPGETALPAGATATVPLVVGGAALATALANSPSKYETLNAAPTAGDFAQVEYVGWGFRMHFRSSPLLGLCDIYVDGALYISGLDLSTGTAAATVLAPAVANGLVVHLEMPLDKHRVKVVARNAAGSLSTANGVIFPTVEVMH